VLRLRGGGLALELIQAGSTGCAEAAVWPGSGASHRSIHSIRLDGGGRTVRQEHPMESVYYVVSGAGSVVGDSASESAELVEGSMVHVEAGTGYRFAAGSAGLELFGGPCPPDPALYAAIVKA